MMKFGVVGLALLAMLPSVAAQGNDQCNRASNIRSGDTISSTTVGALEEIGTPFCGADTTTSPGIWYQFRGTGRIMTATTCEQAEYATALAVYEGGCDELVCVAGDGLTDTCVDGTEVTWSAQNGVDYQILVHGRDIPSSPFQEAGTFQLTLTEGAVVPTNQECFNAVPISTGDTVSGTTLGATVELNAPFCAAPSGTSPGVWYRFVGEGSVVTASTCENTNYDSGIAVYTGNCQDISSMSCVAGNDDAGNIECGSAAEVTFVALQGVQYYILIHGFEGSEGDFSLTLSGGDLIPDNNVCQQSATIAVGTPISGSTDGAQAADSAPFCGLATDTAPGVWYTMIGTNQQLVASTCEQANFDSAISVFSGNCNNLVCIGGNDDSGSCGDAAEVSWFAQAGVRYFVLVHGFDGVSGDFNLLISQAPEVPQNTDCTAAITFVADTTVSATTIGGLPSESLEFCGTRSDTASSVWYSITGSGRKLTASTCRNSDYNSAIAIYSGLCDDLNCVSGNVQTEGCEDGAEITWNGQAGVEYLVMVHGFFDEGDFNLTITQGEELPANDVCTSAIALAQDVPVSSSTTGATFAFETPVCGGFDSDSSPGLWYSYTGEGNVMVASMCNAATYDTRISVFSGACGTFTCIGGSEDAPGCDTTSKYTWLAERNVEYFILVHGAAGSSGDFTLTLEQGPAIPDNDNCAAANPIRAGDSVLAITTGASIVPQATPLCLVQVYTSPGVWYEFTGSGRIVTASTCDQAAYDTAITVFSGSCNALQCIGTNDDGMGCSETSEMTFSGYSGVPYYILVHGFDGSNGEFTLDIEEGPVIPVNEECAGAITVTGGQVISGSTIGATSTEMPSCSLFGASSGSSVWYSIAGTDSLMTASLCNSTNYNSRISVFSGSCGDLSCTAENAFIKECGASSEATWIAYSGTTYYVMVHGGFSQRGDFNLTMTQGAPIPANDECSNAISIVGDSKTPGTTVAASVSSEVCGIDSRITPGVWYSFTGTGRATMVSTCGDSEYNSKITVLSGACGTLQCLETSPVEAEQDCADGTQVEWLAKAGVEYFIHVHGEGSESGDFTLTLTEGALIAANDECTSAIMLEKDITVDGSTAKAFPDSAPECDAKSETAKPSPGVWYSLTGSGEFLRVSTCNNADYDTALAVYSGGCGNLTCVSDNDDFDGCGSTSTVLFDAEMDEEYLILVTGYDGSSGDFSLSVEIGPPPPPNDLCSAAVAMPANTSLDGTTVGASSVEGTSQCGADGASPAVYYTFVGTGRITTASVCQQATYDSAISVFSGTCGNFTCVAGNDDADTCGKTSEAEWVAEDGVAYYVVVHGYGTHFGDFTLDMTEYGFPVVATEAPVAAPSPPTPSPPSSAFTPKQSGFGLALVVSAIAGMVFLF